MPIAYRQSRVSALSAAGPGAAIGAFQQAMRARDFVVTAQLPLAPLTNADDIGAMIENLRSSVDAVQISDNLTAEPHMSPIAAASIALANDMDVVLQLNCRDRNRIALQSDIMGAAAIGVTSFVLSRGEKLPASMKQRIKGVFDIGAKRLLATARIIGAADRLVAPPGFFLGSNITVIRPPEGWSADGVDTKADAGSKFVQTQPCLNGQILKRYMAALASLKALRKLSVIVQIPLLDSMGTVNELQRTQRSLLIPKTILRRLEDASDFAHEGATVCSEVLRDAAAIPGVSGVNLLYRGDAAAVVRVIDESGVRRASAH